MIRLTLKQQPTVPLEAESIVPDLTVGADRAAIRALPCFHGKQKCRLDDFFDVDGEASDEIEICGDAAKVKWLGRGMSRGRLRIAGNAGMHLAAYMKGGTVEVTGNASDWLGAEMTGGVIHVRGNAGGQVGAAYRGSPKGMRNGTILIEGTAGLEVGMRMRRGLIVVRGLVRDFAGLQMKGGTIVLMSGAELRTGAWMNRGTIVSLKPLRLLPTFLSAGDGIPTIMRVLARHLYTLGFAIPIDAAIGGYRRYSGDTCVPGKGEIFTWQPD